MFETIITPITTGPASTAGATPTCTIIVPAVERTYSPAFSSFHDNRIALIIGIIKLYKIPIVRLTQQGFTETWSVVPTLSIGILSDDNGVQYLLFR
eukprot:CAMPEP_0197071314 /NCGR_PEP_ID=MMETSP1384-20130603/205840_1 /TAXON_ID=29189 /ORGANISM="Ammonia sp." /LENGTH=95 /DNA_ID=CAMNT_0042509925 /DNA_START=100 /DNA_END=384 /DNA_ORIENTATION=+